MSDNSKTKINAIGMLSGGLDSILAAKIIHNLGIKVYGVCFIMPWEDESKKNRIRKMAEHIDISPIFLQLDNEFIKMIKNPDHGYGSAINPCIDCKIHMLKKASKLMGKLNANFIFTGEVLGQRPMSQLREKLNIIEKCSGLKGKLLRPLSARLLEPTEIEKEGLIDRTKLLDISGRSRRMQIELAQKFNISNYSQPAGGCLLTDKNFANRLNDLFEHGGLNCDDTKILKIGRHFRINDNVKVILGRNQEENEQLLKLADKENIAMQLKNNISGTLILENRGHPPENNLLSYIGGIVQYFSKQRDKNPEIIKYWKIQDELINTKEILAKKISKEEIECIKI